MTLQQLWKAVGSLKLCVDSVRLLQSTQRQSLSAQDWIFRFLRFSPLLLEQAASSGGNPLQVADSFSQAVSYFRFGAIFKLTSRARTNIADAVVLRVASEYSRPRLLEAGVSDGSSAAGLLAQRLLFSEILLTDRHNVFYYLDLPLGRLFFDADGRPMLFKLLGLCIEPPTQCCSLPPEARRIETANPMIRKGYGITRIEPFDIFCDVLPTPVQVIKCANLLNLSYFTGEQIEQAVDNLAQSLCPGGALVISQNNARYSDAEACFLLRKQGEGMRKTEAINAHDAADLFPWGEGCKPGAGD